jgi:hypothetical protein
VPWQPEEIDVSELAFLHFIGSTGTIQIEGHAGLNRFVRDNGIDLEKIIERLTTKGLIYLDDGRIGQLVDNLMVVAHGGKFYAGENNNGEMVSYFTK